MILSAALDKGLLFLSLVAVLTSVIGAVYYLSIVKEMFFSVPDYNVNTLLENLILKGNVLDKNKAIVRKVSFKYSNIAISSPIAFVISNITLIILLFIFINREWLSMGKQKLLSFFNEIYSIYNKSIKCFCFLKTYYTIFINNYTTNIKNNNNKLNRGACASDLHISLLRYALRSRPLRVLLLLFLLLSFGRRSHASQ